MTVSTRLETKSDKPLSARHSSGTTEAGHVLKGGHFMVSRTKASEIFIPEELTEEQRMIATMVREFIEAEIYPVLEALDAHTDPGMNPALLEKAGELGLTGLSIDEEYGGMGLDFTTGLVFGERIAEAFSFATTIGAHTSIGSLPIVFYGNEAQRTKYLPKLATAELKAAYCLTEPGAGSDANSGKSRATPTPDGKHYLLNGQKMWITNGGFADIFIVFAKIEADENLSAFIVEKAFGGIEMGQEEKKLGIRGSSTVQLFFTDCPVPVENLLGERGGGFKIALNILNTGRLRLAAGSVGGSKMGITKAVKYAIERKQFNKSIAEFGAIQYKLAEMAIRTFVTESGVYRIGKNIDRKTEALKAAGMPGNEAKPMAIREFAIECAILKVFGSEVADYVVDEAVQVFGGMGYSEEAGVERGYRDARILRIYEGTSEINRMLSVGELFKRAFRDKSIPLTAAMKSLPGYLAATFNPFKSLSGFDPERRQVGNLKKAFLLVSGKAAQKLKLGLADEQEIVINLADMMAEAFIAESALLRVEKLHSLAQLSEAELSIRRKIVQVFLYDATARSRKAGKDAIQSYATGFDKRLLHGMLNRLTVQADINPKSLRRDIAACLIRQEGYCF
jgi:alkylation response protein AidB-like acyl-CoA dehydrogenase